MCYRTSPSCRNACIALIILLGSPLHAADELIFSGGFESGSPCLWSTVATPEFCFDGVDQDCDGDIDLDDADCASTLCSPCSSAADCLGATDLCLDLDGGSYCGQDCSEGNPYGTAAGECASEFTCSSDQCQPVTASCTCNSSTDSTVRACTITVYNGTCDGSQTCDAVSGWSACVYDGPGETPDLCDDGLDNDCDGTIDCSDADCDYSGSCQQDGWPCSSNDDCLSAYCNNGFCCSSGICCASNPDCPAGMVCASFVCVSAP